MRFREQKGLVKMSTILISMRDSFHFITHLIRNIPRHL